MEESQQRRTAHLVGASLHHLLTGMELQRAQAVFIQVVGIDFLYGKGCIAIATPSAAEIQLGEDAANAVAAREHQSQGIVLTIRGVGELHLAQHRGEEGTRSTQSVDTQRVVRTVLVGPLLMVYQSRGQRVQLEIAHPVGSDDHRCLLLVERVDDGLQRLGRRVEVVRVQLDGKASALLTIDSHIPASSDTQVTALGNEVYQRLVLLGQFAEDIRRAVGRMVIHHDDVIFERCLLRQRTLHRITDGLGAVVDGDDHRGLHVELLFVEVYLAILRGVYQRLHLAQMGRTGLFHLYLHVAVGGIHIVKLLHTRSSQVGLLLGIQVFVQVQDTSLATQEEAQVVESGILIVALTIAGGIFVQQRGAQQPQAAEVEVVAQRTFLIVYHGMQLALALLHRIAVAIHHRSTFVGGHEHQSLQGRTAQRQRLCLHAEQHVVGYGEFGHFHHEVATGQIVRHDETTVLRCLCLFSQQWADHQVDMSDRTTLTQMGHQGLYVSHCATG